MPIHSSWCLLSLDLVKWIIDPLALHQILIWFSDMRIFNLTESRLALVLPSLTGLPLQIVLLPDLLVSPVAGRIVPWILEVEEV